MKPGYRTSEFWLTLSAQVLALLVLLGYVTVEESQLIRDQTVQVVALAAPFVVAAVSLGAYIYARMRVKLGETEVIELVNTENNKIG